MSPLREIKVVKLINGKVEGREEDKTRNCLEKRKELKEIRR